MEVCIPGFDIALTADSGQCFRFEPLGGDVWQVIAGGRLLRLRALGGGRFDFDCDGDSFDAFWRGYFDLERDYGAVALGASRRRLPDWRPAAMPAGSGYCGRSPSKR